MNEPWREVVERLALQPHPEGGFFRETYRSAETLSREALPPRFPGPRSVATTIYYLLRAGDRSVFHRIRSDEGWHFYAGGPMRVVELHADGSLRETVLGPRLAEGQVFQHVVPAGVWFAAQPLSGSAYSLAGCTVAPGFDFADFEIAGRAALLAAFPGQAAAIEAFT